MSNEGFLNPTAVMDLIGLEEGMIVADFGCGTGEIAIAMAKRIGPSGLVTALDILTSSLEAVHGKAIAEGLQNIKVSRVNLEVPGGTKLSEGSQQMVYLGNVLWQAEKKDEVIKEAARVLAPNGRVVAVEWNPGTGGFGPPDTSRVSGDRLKELFALAGLEVVQNFVAGKFHFGMIAQKHA